MSKSLHCKNCGQNLFQYKENKIKVRTNILIFEKSIENDFTDCNAIIKCSNCKHDNKVPIVLDTKNSDFKFFIFDYQKKK